VCFQHNSSNCYNCIRGTQLENVDADAETKLFNPISRKKLRQYFTETLASASGVILLPDADAEMQTFGMPTQLHQPQT
jgi:hypothetical protein